MTSEQLQTVGALLRENAEVQPHIAAGEHVQIAGILNRRDIAARRYVPTDVLMNAAMQIGRYAPIKMIAAGMVEAPDQVRGLCITLIDTFTTTKAFPEIDLDNPSVQILLGGLIASGLLSQEEMDTAIMPLGNTLISLAEQVLGVGMVATHSDVAEALALVPPPAPPEEPGEEEGGE